MIITLTSKEFNEAVSLWLEDQGFSPDNYDISTRTIAGRSDGHLGTRLEVTLDAKPRTTTSILEVMGIARSADGGVGDISTFSQRASQGHADE